MAIMPVKLSIEYQNGNIASKFEQGLPKWQYCNIESKVEH